MKPIEPSFDRIARPYHWLEYLTLGKALERCRNHHLPQLLDRRHALVLGDGDGRFLAQLLKQNPNLLVSLANALFGGWGGGFDGRGGRGWLRGGGLRGVGDAEVVVVFALLGDEGIDDLRGELGGVVAPVSMLP
ncbi:MAG: methyltransferase type 12 [Edaphobacter sp.]|nr:methyltransferase type 12 [Edaphobacter sp.]